MVSRHGRRRNGPIRSYLLVPSPFRGRCGADVQLSDHGGEFCDQGSDAALFEDPQQLAVVPRLLGRCSGGPVPHVVRASCSLSASEITSTSSRSWRRCARYRSLRSRQGGLTPPPLQSLRVREIAEACADVDARYRAFVLVHGLCGPRPGEAIELRRRDINV